MPSNFGLRRVYAGANPFKKWTPGRKNSRLPSGKSLYRGKEHERFCSHHDKICVYNEHPIAGPDIQYLNSSKYVVLWLPVLVLLA